MNKQTNLEALQARAEQLRQDIAKAENDATQACAALVDATTPAAKEKLHQAHDVARRNLDRAERELLSVSEAIDREQDQVDEADFAERCKTAKAKAAVWLHHAKTLHEKAQQLAEALKACSAAGDAYRDSLPIEVPSSEWGSFAFMPAPLVSLANRELYIASDGKFNGGRFGMPPAVLAQGPGLVAQVKENIARLSERMERAANQKDAA